MAANPTVPVDPASSFQGGWQVQDPATGEWKPYPDQDNGRGNVRGPDGTVYSNVAGADAFKASAAPAAPTAPATPPPAAAPPAPPGGNTGGPAAPGIGYGPLTAPFSTPWAPTANTPYPTQPTFSFKDFTAPSYTEAQNDPGYQFRLDQGQHALENSRAGTGILNTGMTLKDILDYGQNAASQEYGNVYNRAANTYNLNLGTAQAEFAPLMSGWQTNMAATQRGNEFANTQSLRKWEDDAANFRNWQNDAWQKYFAGASA